jgi:hypothetical protein
MEHRIKTADGRTLAVQEAGTGNGSRRGFRARRPGCSTTTGT